MATQSTVKTRRKKRQVRSRKKIFGFTARPRLCVSKSNKHILAQVINDETSTTICAISSYSPDFKDKIKGWDTAGAEVIGKAIAEKAKAEGVEQVVFDRTGNPYHGRIKALAEAARKAGLEF